MKEFLQRLKALIESMFSSTPKQEVPKPVVVPPVTAPTVKNAKEILQQEFIDLCAKDVGQREPNGSNRSPMIDEGNRAAGVALGSPYCITMLLFRLRQLCLKKNLKMPIHVEASTQEFWRDVPVKYKIMKGLKALKACIGIMQSYSNPGQGHAYLLTLDQTDAKKQDSLEYNTDPNTGDRDGDGVYIRTRTQDGDAAKKYLGAVDIIQWIIDVNPGKIVDKAVEPVVNPPVTTTPSPATDIVLSWEKGHPERKAWTDFVVEKIGKDFFGSFDRAKDATRFAANYYVLTKAQKIHMWAEFICQMAYHESNWNPGSNSVDVGNASDRDTHSIGLMQMSVVDQKNYASAYGPQFKLGYDYNTLIKPIPNLHLALMILAHQLEKYGKIMHVAPDSKGLYWAVIYDGGKYDKTDAIIKSVKALPFVD